MMPSPRFRHRASQLRAGYPAHRRLHDGNFHTQQLGHSILELHGFPVLSLPEHPVSLKRHRQLEVLLIDQP